jgi:formate C-acetyltransferase
MVNTIAAIRKWVFEEKKYMMEDVLGALRYNFEAPDSVPPEKKEIYSNIHDDFFLRSPKFGNNDPVADEIARQVVDCFLEALDEAKVFADDVYRFTPADPKKAKRNQRLRMTAGYYGPPIQDHLRKNEVTIAFTAGLGTFATYALMGLGTAASADRGANEPLAMNNTPTPGTVARGFGHTLASLKALDLSRFPAGAPVDLCLEMADATAEDKAAVAKAVIEGFLKNNCNTLSLTLGNREQYKEIYQLAVRASKNEPGAADDLLKWGHVIVRAGGWQTPFITMSLVQQKRYTRAPVAP